MTKSKPNIKNNAHRFHRLLLFERKIVKLEKEFQKTLDAIISLEKELESGGANIKEQMSFLDDKMKALREQVAYYIKLGEIYDIARLGKAFFDALSERAPELMKEIIEEVDENLDDLN